MRSCVLLTLPLCVFLAAACGKGTPYYKDSQTAATPTPTSTPDSGRPFAQSAAELTKVPATVKLSGDGYIKGKAARYHQNVSLKDKETEGKTATWTWDSSVLPVMKAETPADVQTVVLQKCVETSMGTFAQKLGTGEAIGEKIPAFGWKCDVTVIDKTIPAVVGRKTFESEIKDSEVVSQGAKEIRRAPPSVEIDNYLKALPKQ